MIPIETLRALTPEAPDDLAEHADPRELAAARSDPLLRDLSLWTGYFRKVLRRAIAESFLGGLMERTLMIGTGIIDWPDTTGSGDFKAVGGFRLGIAAYVPRSAEMAPAGEFIVLSAPRFLPEEDRDRPGWPKDLPFAILPADFTPSAHPPVGRTAAVARDAVGRRMLLTAGHVVGRKALATRMTLRCTSCQGGCHALVEAKGSGYIDAAILRVVQANCLSLAQPAASLAVPLTGQTVKHHFGSQPAAVKATVMQGLAPPVAAINPVAPRTFLTDGQGQAGDSGSAVTDNPPNHTPPAVAGIHSGRTEILLAPGQIVKRSYAQDADEALRLFNCTLLEGIYR